MTPQPPVPPEHDRWRDELHLAAASGRRPGPALDAHLQHCSACREEWALLQTITRHAHREAETAKAHRG